MFNTSSMPTAPLLHNRQRGTSMIEVLLSMFVVGGVLLNVGGYQVISVKNANSAETRHRASVLVYELVERMRSNLVAVQGGFYNELAVNGGEEAIECSAGCSSADISALDAYEWGQKIERLPNGQGSVTHQGNNRFKVSVSWQEQNTGYQASANGSQAEQSGAGGPQDSDGEANASIATLDQHVTITVQL